MVDNFLSFVKSGIREGYFFFGQANPWIRVYKTWAILILQF